MRTNVSPLSSSTSMRQVRLGITRAIHRVFKRLIQLKLVPVTSVVRIIWSPPKTILEPTLKLLVTLLLSLLHLPLFHQSHRLSPCSPNPAKFTSSIDMAPPLHL